MKSSVLSVVAVASVSTLLFASACKRGEETVAGGDASAPAPVATTPPTDQPAATTPPATPPPGQPPPGTGPALKADAGVKDAGVTDAGGTADAGKTDAGASAGGGNLTACLQKCTASLQTCLTPAASDGGFPKLKDPAACNKVAEQCRAVCGP